MVLFLEIRNDSVSICREIGMNLFSIFQAALISVLVLLVLSFLVAMCSPNPDWSYQLLGLDSKAKPKNEVLKFLGLSMGGVLVALQALMSYKRANALENTVVLTEKGQRQERMKNAIEHLGHASESVRLGGAYELFHLAEDSDTLRQTVLDILCAHIRQTTGAREYREKHKSKPSEEVQSLLTLLFVKNHKIFRGLHVNLKESYLNGADIREAHLEQADLAKAYLQGTIFMEAHLQRANFREAYLQGANLDIAHMQAADFIEAHMQGAQLMDARLQGAQLFGAHMQGAQLFSARLQGARLGGAKFQEADLSVAHMEGVNSVIAPDTFADRICQRIDKEADLTGVVFAGGLSREDADSLVEGLSNEKAEELREKLASHIGEAESDELPRRFSHIFTGAYSEEEAEKWIAEYEEAMSGIPEDDS